MKFEIWNDCGYVFAVVVAENPISKKAQSFLAQHIRSVEQLEIFLALAKEPHRSMTVAQVFKQIQSSERSISAGLQEFARKGLAIGDENGRFCLCEKPESLIEVARELQGLYRERRVTIIEQIYAKATSPIESFAEAFKLRKDQ